MSVYSNSTKLLKNNAKYNHDFKILNEYNSNQLYKNSNLSGLKSKYLNNNMNNIELKEYSNLNYFTKVPQSQETNKLDKNKKCLSYLYTERIISPHYEFDEKDKILNFDFINGENSNERFKAFLESLNIKNNLGELKNNDKNNNKKLDLYYDILQINKNNLNNIIGDGSITNSNILKNSYLPLKKQTSGYKVKKLEIMNSIKKSPNIKSKDCVNIHHKNSVINNYFERNAIKINIKSPRENLEDQKNPQNQNNKSEKPDKNGFFMLKKDYFIQNLMEKGSNGNLNGIIENLNKKESIINVNSSNKQNKLAKIEHKSTNSISNLKSKELKTEIMQEENKEKSIENQSSPKNYIESTKKIGKFELKFPKNFLIETPIISINEEPINMKVLKEYLSIRNFSNFKLFPSHLVKKNLKLHKKQLSQAVSENSSNFMFFESIRKRNCYSSNKSNENLSNICNDFYDKNEKNSPINEYERILFSPNFKNSISEKFPKTEKKLFKNNNTTTLQKNILKNSSPGIFLYDKNMKLNYYRARELSSVSRKSKKNKKNNNDKLNGEKFKKEEQMNLNIQNANNSSDFEIKIRKPLLTRKAKNNSPNFDNKIFKNELIKDNFERENDMNHYYDNAIQQEYNEIRSKNSHVVNEYKLEKLGENREEQYKNKYLNIKTEVEIKEEKNSLKEIIEIDLRQEEDKEKDIMIPDGSKYDQYKSDFALNYLQGNVTSNVIHENNNLNLKSKNYSLFKNSVIQSKNIPIIPNINNKTFNNIHYRNYVENKIVKNEQIIINKINKTSVSSTLLNALNEKRGKINEKTEKMTNFKIYDEINTRNQMGNIIQKETSNNENNENLENINQSIKSNRILDFEHMNYVIGADFYKETKTSMQNSIKNEKGVQSSKNFFEENGFNNLKNNQNIKYKKRKRNINSSYNQIKNDRFGFDLGDYLFSKNITYDNNPLYKLSKGRSPPKSASELQRSKVSYNKPPPNTFRGIFTPGKIKLSTIFKINS